MTIKKNIPIILKDGKNVRNIVVKVDIKQNTTTVFSGFSSWENLALLLEALGTTAQKCIKDGISKKQVYGAIKDYMVKVLSSYETQLDGEKLGEASTFCTNSIPISFVPTLRLCSVYKHSQEHWNKIFVNGCLSKRTYYKIV